MTPRGRLHLNDSDRRKIEKAVKTAETGTVAVLYTDSSWLVYDMGSVLSSRRVQQWVKEKPELLVGFYTQRFGMKAAELRQLMVEDLTFVGAI